jgi:hypothetical protein
MWTARGAILPLICVIAANSVSLNLGASDKLPLNTILLERMRKLYGSAAPASVTYVDASDAPPQTTQSPGDGRVPTSQNYGDIGSGAIIAELDGKLYLDTKPCTGRIATFVKPYKKVHLGTSTCGNKTIEKFQIEERQK